MYLSVDASTERALFRPFANRYGYGATQADVEGELGGASLCCEGGACVHGGARSESRAEQRKLELADLFAKYGSSLRLSSHQRRTVRAIVRCRTVQMGRHRRVCEACSYSEDSFNSCRNRHCPKCQRLDEVQWLDRQMRDVLPIPYHHVVFTVPHELHAYFRVAPKLAYQQLFAAVAETLQEVAARPSNLGAKIGFTAILHTWNQRLLFHPHVHCIVTGGGLSADGERWIAAKPKFLFSVKVLSLLFRGKLLRRLEEASENGHIALPVEVARDARRRAARKPWTVYSKPPMGGPAQVLRYLGRYTHRVALSNSRLVSLADDQVTFRWRDRSDGNRVKLETLDAVQFCKRFVQHIVPPAFQRIRHYGLLGNGVRRKAVALCRERLGAPPPPMPVANEPWWDLFERITGRPLPKCPQCGEGRLIDAEALWLPPRHLPARSPPRTATST